MGGYAIRGGEAGKRRLDLLAQVMAPSTEALLQRVGLRRGMNCLDLGCGGGHVTRLLAQRVASEGGVVGIDMDAVKVAAAEQECRSAGLLNVDFRVANVIGWAEPETYDLVFGRFILSHLPTRIEVLAEMRRALRPGGVVVLEDIDFSGAFCYPPNAAYERYCELYRAVIQRRGGDADLGAKLYGMCLDVGLRDIEVSVVHPVHRGQDPGKQLSVSTLLNIGDAAIAEGLIAEAELQSTVGALTAFTDDPFTIIGVPRIFQVCGRRA